jgi:hypothetical protein
VTSEEVVTADEEREDDRVRVTPYEVGRYLPLL